MELSIPAVLFTLASIVVLILFLRAPKQEQLRFRGSIAIALLVTVLSLTFILPADWQLIDFINRHLIASAVIVLLTLSYGYLLFANLNLYQRLPRLQTLWQIASALWFIATIIGATIAPNLPETALPATTAQSIPMLIGLAGITLLGGALVMILIWDYHRISLPQLANRSAYYLVVTLSLIIGCGFILSSLPSLILPGLMFIYLSLLGLLYVYTTHQIINVRLGIILSIRNLAILTLLTIAILFPLYIIDQLNLTDSLVGTFAGVGIATFVAVFCLPILQLIRDIFQKLTDTVNIDLSYAIATYSHAVSLSTSLEDVVTATTKTLNQVLNINRSSLILINSSFRKENTVEFVVLSGVSASSNNQLTLISMDNPVYQAFVKDRIALTQYDIDFDPKYASIKPDERKFFQSLYLRAYAPIVSENNLIGIIGCAPKLNDTAYTDDELELLLVIGQQVGTALRSARLIDDLRHLNTSMSSMNKQLQVAKQDLEKLDSIKSDFVTIASHELRTPLAQVRGYTDFIDSLNQQNMLDEKQTSKLVNNLRRAIDRMEELISAMMDVSQLDVDAMDLHFVSTKPETIVKLALDPLQDAIDTRNLTVEKKGLSDLPPIQSDMQRIVQAFNNILVNAIKFTPDSGKIEISGKTELRDNMDHVVIAIKDTGVGIHSHDLDLIFQKFYRGFDPQLHSSGNYKFMGAGPGLGTTIAKGIIEGHGGKIWAESTGHDMETLPGSTFFISMPITPPESARRVLPIDPENTSDIRETSPSQIVSPITESTPSPDLKDNKNTAEVKKP